MQSGQTGAYDTSATCTLVQWYHPCSSDWAADSFSAPMCEWPLPNGLRLWRHSLGLMTTEKSAGSSMCRGRR